MARKSGPLVKPITRSVCVTSGVSPDSFKANKMVSLLKKCNPNETDNYRPISITPLFGNFRMNFEKILTDYFETNNFFHHNQFSQSLNLYVT